LNALKTIISPAIIVQPSLRILCLRHELIRLSWYFDLLSLQNRATNDVIRRISLDSFAPSFLNSISSRFLGVVLPKFIKPVVLNDFL